jgi:hypothetical protein
MKPFKQFFSLLLAVIVLGAVGLAAFGKLPKGPVNLIEFLVASDFLLVPFLIYAAFTAKEKDARKPWMRKTLNYIAIAEILLFAWGGFFWCAAASVFVGLAETIWRDRDPQKVAAAQAADAAKTL